MKRFLKWIVPATVILVMLMLLRFVLFIGYVPTESMEPTIYKGSYIIGSRLFGELKVGDIIVFEHEGKPLVKRIAAVGGDVVEHNGQRLTVPEGYFYVLGDNTQSSFDSRYWKDPFVQSKNLLSVLVT